MTQCGPWGLTGVFEDGAPEIVQGVAALILMLELGDGDQHDEDGIQIT